jgi:hypothetical protein
MVDMHVAYPRASDCAQFDMCPRSVSSCGRLEAIAQVGVPNIAASGTRREFKY